MTQKKMAQALGITTEAYRKNEGRSPLPHHLIPRFAAIVGVSIEFLVTGQNPSVERKRKTVSGGGLGGPS